MCESKVSNIDPNVGSGVGDLVLAFALNEITYALVGGIDRLERIEMVDYGPKDHRGVDGRDGEVWLLVLLEFPCRPLSKCLARCSRLLDKEEQSKLGTGIPLYPLAGFWVASCSVMGFQSSSE